MEIKGYQFSADCVTKFHRSVFVWGWFHHRNDALADIQILDPLIHSTATQVGVFHGGVPSLGTDKGFEFQALLTEDRFPESATVMFITKSGEKVAVPLQVLAEEPLVHSPTNDLSQRFHKLVQAKPGAKLLDVGGRDRSDVLRSRYFPNQEVTVFDIVASDAVDVVGDAHELSRHFPKDTFDFVQSVSVFEHLLMPWKVAVEMAKVMKKGGVAMIHTHQCLGMHDMPWDFWRFSDTAWPAVFNRETGFEILGAAMSHPHFLLPFHYRPDKVDAEKSAGFESSTVLIRKVGEPKVDWPVPLKKLINTHYPKG